MTPRRVGSAVTALLVAGLLAGCSGGEDDPAPGTATSSVAPTSPRTPPPISPRTTLTFTPGSTLPEVTTPPRGGGPPVPVPSAPQS